MPKKAGRKATAGTDTWPIMGDQEKYWGSAGGYLNFFAQSFHLSSDDRAESTQEGQGWAGAGGMIHNITLPYTNVSTTETSTWDTGSGNQTGSTDASIGWEWYDDKVYDVAEWVGLSTVYNNVNMEVNSAGFKGPVLRQRHYSWNLVNRSGGEGEGRVIAQICRKFQASVYPTMDPTRTADNIVNPPPMWTTTYFPEKSEEGPGQNIGTNPVSSASIGSLDPDNPRVPKTLKQSERKSIKKRFDSGGFNVDGSQFTHPVATPGAWRWSMDPFTSVLLNVTISPTEATDGVMTMTQSGWPLVTVLKLSFLEVDQCIAKQGHDSIIPYSWASNTSDSIHAVGFGGDYSHL